jgi:hypothetical protein
MVSTIFVRRLVISTHMIIFVYKIYVNRLRTSSHQKILQHVHFDNHTIYSYINTDWKNDPNDWKVLMDCIFKLVGGFIFWTSKKQHILLFIDAKAKAIANWKVWLNQHDHKCWSRGLNVICQILFHFYCDNWCVLNLFYHIKLLKELRHLALLYCRILIFKGSRFFCIPISNQVADIMTKSLSK